MENKKTHGDLTTCFGILSEMPRMAPFLPALVTMRRHAKAGLLRGCEISGKNRRPMYKVALLHDHYFGGDLGDGDQFDGKSTHRPITAQNSAKNLDVEGGIKILELVEQHGVAVALLQSQIHEMSQVMLVIQREVQGLNAVRQSLMSKYDSSHAGAVAMVSTLREQIGRGASVDHSLILGIMQNDLKIVKNSINDLAGQLRVG